MSALKASVANGKEGGVGRAHDFSLVLDGHDVLSPVTVDALFEAGCDDATLGEVDGVAFADFTREAATAADAMLSAIRDVESVEGIRVLRVEPDDLVTATEIAGRLGRSRESVRLWVEGTRGPGNFPPPASHLRARTRLWRWVEVTRWLRTFRSGIREEGDAVFVAALNDALALRWFYPTLPGAQRDAIAAMLPGSLRPRGSSVGEFRGLPLIDDLESDRRPQSR